MDHSSGDVGEASDCDIEVYEEKAYEELKSGKIQINLPNNTFACPYCSNNTSRDYQYKELLQHATMVGKTDSQKLSKRERGSHLALAKYLEKDQTEACGQSQPKCDVDCLANHDGDAIFVWPWKVVVANLPTRLRCGINFGPSETDIREDLATRGFNPKKVHSLWNVADHSGFAVIDFGDDWLGFYNAMEFEKAYEIDHHGKKDWNSENGSKTGSYGWVARGDDYTSIDVYGEHLRKSADVMSISDIMADEHRKRYKLKNNLTKISEERKSKYDEMERNYMETKNTLSKLIAEKDQIHQSHNEDMRKMNVLDLENANLKTELESQLCKTNALTQENGKLMEEITFQQKELEQRAKERDERESQIAQNIFDCCSSFMSARTKELEEKVTELEEELQYKDSLNQALIIREHDSNKELQDAHKELKNALSQFMEVTTVIGLKRMGEVVSKPFQDVCMQRFSSQDWSLKTAEITSLWEERVNNPQWHPFKPIFKDGKLQEIVDEDDSHMKEVRSQWGKEAYNASARYVESVLWNFKEGRKAKFKEVIASLINQLKAARSYKRRRTGHQQN